MVRRTKATGLLRRPLPFVTRLNAREYADLEKRAAQAKLNMSEYARCKMFDIPFEQLGGISPRRKSITEKDHTPPNP